MRKGQSAGERNSKPFASDGSCDLHMECGAFPPLLFLRKNQSGGWSPHSKSSDYRHFKNATRSCFSSSLRPVSNTRLKNSTTSSSVSSRPSCKYGGDSSIPRNVNVL